MKNKIIAITLISLSTGLNAQIGINTTSPKTTMDITGMDDASHIAGLQAPRLTLLQLTDKGDTLYGTDQKGALLYISDISAGTSVNQRVNINQIGYYYFDGFVWERIANQQVPISYTGSTSVTLVGNSFQRSALTGDVTAAVNSNVTSIADNAVTSAKILDETIANADLVTGAGGIYKGSGSLVEATTVAQGVNKLAFTNTEVNAFSVDGTTFSVDAKNNRIGIGTAAPTAKLEITTGTANTSGLKFTNLTSTSATVAGKSLGVTADGTVVTIPAPLATGVSTTILSPASGTEFTITGNSYITVPNSIQTITIPAGGRALFINYMIGIDYLDLYTNTGLGTLVDPPSGTSYYTARLYIDNVQTNVFQVAQERGKNSNAEFNLSYVTFLSAGNHRLDVAISRTTNFGTDTNAYAMRSAVTSVNANFSYLNN